MGRKRKYGTDNIKPSKEFNDYEFSLYLEYASVDELENDSISGVTARKIIRSIDGDSLLAEIMFKEEQKLITDILMGK